MRNPRAYRNVAQNQCNELSIISHKDFSILSLFLVPFEIGSHYIFLAGSGLTMYSTLTLKLWPSTYLSLLSTGNIVYTPQAWLFQNSFDMLSCISIHLLNQLSTNCIAGFESRASYLLSNLCTTELHFQLPHSFSLIGFINLILYVVFSIVINTTFAVALG